MCWCHVIWFAFLVPLVAMALLRNPRPELGVGWLHNCTVWHVAVAELHIVFKHVLEVVAPLRVTKSSIILLKRCFKDSTLTSKSVDTWLFLVLALAISSLVSPLLGFLFVALTHAGES